MRLTTYIPVLAAALFVVALQILLSVTDTTYYMTQITMSAYEALVVVGLCLLMGYAGQVSLGHAGFFAIGGYTSAVLTTGNLAAYRDNAAISWCRGMGLLVQRQDIYGADVLSIAPPLGCAAALLLTAAVALLIGLPVIRLKGHYLAMATLGFGLIVYRIVLGVKCLGQADGIFDVPPLEIAAGLQVNGRAAFRLQNYYMAWAAVLVAMVLSLHLVRSRVGRALSAIHQNEEAAHSLGVDVHRYKLAIFVLSALLAALGGVLLTHHNGSISPSASTVMRSVRYVAVVAMGGMANLWGVVVMGVLLNFLSLRRVFGVYDDAVFGASLIGIMLIAPEGLWRSVNWRGVSFLLTRRSHGRHAA